MHRLVAFLVLLLAPGLLAQDQKAPAASIERAGWLAGQWRRERNGQVVDEHWMAPAGGVMLGMSRTVAKGKVLSHEFLQIREGPGGDLFLVAQPSRQKEAAFRLVVQTDTEIRFENRDHDFPQVISYSRQPDGSVLAFVEGPRADGTVRRIEYRYWRVAP